MPMTMLQHLARKDTRLLLWRTCAWILQHLYCKFMLKIWMRGTMVKLDTPLYLVMKVVSAHVTFVLIFQF
jgi:hypothetical protein